MRCGARTRVSSYENIQRGRKDFESAEMQRVHFAVHHGVNGGIQIENDPARRVARSERVLQVCAVVQRGQIVEQAEAADRPPTNELNQAVGSIGMRRNHHLAACEFAVVEAEKEAAAAVEFRGVVQTHGKSAAAQAHQPDQHTEEIPKLTERRAAAMRESSNVGRKTDAEQVDGIEHAAGVREAEQVARPTPAFDKSLCGLLGAALAKIAEERISGAEGKKAERDARALRGFGKQTVDDFMSGAVAADGDEFLIALRIGLARKRSGLAWSGAGDDVHTRAGLAELGDRSLSELAAAASARFGIHDGEEAVFHSRLTAEARSSRASCSARMLRLILREAVRGKSWFQRTQPLMRL